ncbi:MAG TPA: nuclear transport factor 2 family protein [Vicinamibacteria bacterium]|jgi:ketosteroid isomerase-like protein|nr:nuclear transport factor 2 family protein [Vicinamibacteria bacterium]
MTRTVALCLMVSVVALGRLDADDEADHEALRKIRRVYEQAVAEDNVELLVPHLDPQFTAVMLTGELVVGADGMRGYWRRIKDLMGPGGRYTVTVEPDLSTLLGDVALAKGTTSDVVATDQGEYRFKSQWTAVCRRVDGQWKVLRIQGSMDPVGNPFVKKALTRSAVWSGGGGLGVGSVVGLLAGVVLRRRGSKTAS